MPKGSPQLTAARKDEIMNACERLYQTMNFKEITLKEIGEETSFTRTSIYNYFQTKEEIFLALFEREYRRWIADLEVIYQGCGPDAKALAERLAQSLQKRELLLKLLSVNLYDMEENSRMEALIAFKSVYRDSVSVMGRILEKCFPLRSPEERQETTLAIFAYMQGIYPYAYATEKQQTAMKEAGFAFQKHTIEEMARIGLEKLLAD